MTPQVVDAIKNVASNLANNTLLDHETINNALSSIIISLPENILRCNLTINESREVINHINNLRVNLL